MNIAQTWRDSLTIFLPKNLKLFLLITLKSIIETYKTLFRYFWWLILLNIIVEPLLWFVWDSTHAQWAWWLIHYIPVSLLLMFLFYCALFLCARPSVKKKDYAYFKDYPFHCLYIIVFFTGITYEITRFWFQLPPTLFHRLVNSIAVIAVGYYWITPLFKGAAGIISGIVLSPISAFFILFLLNSEGTVRTIGASLLRAVKMVIYNYPFCLIVYLLWCYGLPLAWLQSTIAAALYPLTTLLHVSAVKINYHEMISSSIVFLLLPIPIHIWINFYIKKLHEQFSLYFKQSV